MKLYHIKPFDTVVFGENRSSEMGDDHEKGSKFPPEIMKLFNLGEELTFMGIFPVKDNKIYMPMPADALCKRKQKGGPCYIPKLTDFSSWMEFEVDIFEEKKISRGLLPWVGKFEALEKAGGYISLRAFFKKYMSISSGKLDICEEDKGKELFKEEVRIGISLDYSLHSVKESMLYARVHYRLKDGFVILVSGKPESDIAYLGAERKVVRIEEWKCNGCFYFPDGDKEWIETDKLYKFYLTTHAFINKDIKPGDSIDIGDVVNGGQKIEMEVEWIYSNGAEWISGVDASSNYNKNGKPENKLRKKPAVLMLKPGTVFILRAKKGGEKLSRYSQIKDQPDFPIEEYEGWGNEWKDRFILRGWGSGILWKIKEV